MTISFSAAALAHLHASFLAIVLPRVLSHGRVCFGGLKCPHRREDAIQDMIGLAWTWHLRLAEKGTGNALQAVYNPGVRNMGWPTRFCFWTDSR
jgi:hypothetical protein